MALSVEYPYPIVAKGGALTIRINGGSNKTTAKPYDANLLDLSVGLGENNTSSSNDYYLRVNVMEDVREPKICRYALSDTTGTPAQLVAHVIVVPESSRNDLIVLFYGVDGVMYMLIQKPGTDRPPHLTPLPGYPTLIDKHRGDAQKYPPYNVPDIKDQAAYVTCYLLDFEQLMKDKK